MLHNRQHMVRKQQYMLHNQQNMLRNQQHMLHNQGHMVGWLVGLPLLRLKLMHITQLLELYRVLTITILNPHFASPL